MKLYSEQKDVKLVLQSSRYVGDDPEDEELARNELR